MYLRYNDLSMLMEKPCYIEMSSAKRRRFCLGLSVSYIFSYLPTEIERQKHVQQWEANSFLVYNTHQVYWNVLHWAYLCSLTEKCIAPSDEIRCNFKGSPFDRYAHCHRYDQSMLNLLLSNWHQYDEGRYTAGRYRSLLNAIRKMTNKYDLSFCE